MSLLNQSTSSHWLRVLAIMAVTGVGSWIWFRSLGVIARDVGAPPSPPLASAYPATGASSLDRVTIRGWAVAIDGDTIRLGDQRIRLFGIDAPESTQDCLTDFSQPVAIGAASRLALATLLQGRQVSCEVVATDPYGRLVASCEAGGMDLAGRQVDTGWALDYGKYTQRYVWSEARARQGRLGMWACRHLINPEDYRRQEGANSGA